MFIFNLNTADTRVLAAKLFISGNPIENDVKHLSNENIQTNFVKNQLMKKSMCVMHVSFTM